MFEKGQIFRDPKDGKFYEYTGESGGVPSKSAKNYIPFRITSSEEGITEQTNKALSSSAQNGKEPSLFYGTKNLFSTLAEEEGTAKDIHSVAKDFHRTAYNAASSIPRVIENTIEGLGIFDALSKRFPDSFTKENRARFNVDMAEGFLRAIEDSVVPGTSKINYKGKLRAKDIVDPITGKPYGPETVTGNVVDIASVIGTGALAVSKLPQAKTKAMNFFRYLGGEQIAEQLLMDPKHNVANFIQDLFPDATEENPILDYLAADEEDNILFQRAKMTMSSGLLGATFSGTLEGTKIAAYVTFKYGKKLKDLTAKEVEAVSEEVLPVLRELDIDLSSFKEARQLEDKELAQVLMQNSSGKDNIFSRGASKFFSFKQQMLSSRGALPKRAFSAKRESIQAQRAAVTQAEEIVTRLKKFVDEDIAIYNDPELYKKVQKSLTSNKISDGPEAVKELMKKFGFSKDVAYEVVETRALIDDLSESILGTGVATKETSKIIRKNLGTYMRRNYRLFEDKGYKPSDDIINNAVKYISKNLRRANPKLSKEESRIQARNKVDEILDTNWKGSYDGFNATRVATKQILGKRKKIPEEIRALYGEIKDPVENIVLTVSKMSAVAENAKFLSRLKELGEGKYIFKAADRDKIEGAASVFNARIAGTNTSLDGMFTTPQMKVAIEGGEDKIFRPELGKGGWQWTRKLYNNFLSLKGLSQKNQTAYRVQAQIRNGLGGTQFSLSNGLNPFFHISETLDIIGNKLSKEGNLSFANVYEELQGLGVINTSVRAGEYRAILGAAEEAGGSITSILDKGSEILKKVRIGKFELGEKLDRLPDEIYMAVDDTFKINAFYKELEVLRKAKPDSPLNILKKEAAEKVQNTFPNYDLVPPGIKALRDLPFGNFFSYPTEIIRTSANIIKLSAKEISSGNKVLVDRGVNRLTGLVGVQSFWAGIGPVSAARAGFTQDEYESLNTLLETPYSKQHNNILMKEGNKLHVLDPTFVDAANLFRQVGSDLYGPIVKGELYGDDLDNILKESAINVVWNLASPYVSPSILSQTIFDVASASVSPEGKTAGGRKLFDVYTGDTEEALENFLRVGIPHILHSLVPGTFLDVEKVINASIGSEEAINNSTGIANSPELEMLANMSGLRFKEISDIEVLLENHAKTAFHKMNKVTGYMPQYQDTAEDLEEKYKKTQDGKFEHQQNLYRQVLAYKQLFSVSDSIYRIPKILESAGIKGQMANDIFFGRFHPDKPSDFFIDRSFERRFSTIEETGDALKNITSLYNDLSRKPLIPPTEEEREEMRKGGVVKDVPRVPEEPDERIDKMTGLPYDEQAGTAFVDEEDRTDYTHGGKVLKSLKKGVPNNGRN